MSPKDTRPDFSAPDEAAQQHWIENLSDGGHVLIRPIRPEDREREVEFIRNLSPESRRYRFLGTVKEVSPTLLNTLMQVDYKNRTAFVALAHQDGELIEVGVSRYAGTEEGQCECAVTVADAWQNRGLGTALMKRLISTARQNGFKQMYSIESATNTHLLALAHDLGFHCKHDPQDATQVILHLAL